jgi:hypothetical protein
MVPVVILNVRAEVLAPGDAGIRDQRVDDRVERAVVEVDRLAVQVRERVDQSLRCPGLRLRFQLRVADAQVARLKVDDVALAAVVGPAVKMPAPSKVPE